MFVFVLFCFVYIICVYITLYMIDEQLSNVLIIKNVEVNIHSIKFFISFSLLQLNIETMI